MFVQYALPGWRKYTRKRFLAHVLADTNVSAVVVARRVYPVRSCDLLTARPDGGTTRKYGFVFRISPSGVGLL